MCCLQLHCLQYLIHEIVTGGSPKKAGGFFTASETEVPSSELRQLESFFNRLAFFPHVIDYRGTNTECFMYGNYFNKTTLETSRITLHTTLDIFFLVENLCQGYWEVELMYVGKLFIGCSKDYWLIGCMDAATLAHVTDLGFLWFREFYLETSRVIQVRSKVSTV